MNFEPLYRKLDTRVTAVVVAAGWYLFHLLLQVKIAPSEVSAGFAFVFLTTAICVGEVRLSLHLLCLPLFLYGVASTVSALLAPERMHAAGELMLWIKMLTFPTALLLFRLSPRLRVWALWCHAAVVTGSSILGIGQYFLSSRRDLEHRITGFEPHVMTFSGLILPLSVLFAVLWFNQRKHWMLVPAGLGAFALLLTFTRSAWIAWLAAIFTLLVWSRPRLIAYAVPLFILFITFMPVSMFSRVVSSFDTRQESNLDRLRMFEAGVEMIRDHPLLGVGPANVKEVYPLYRAADAPRFRTPHLHDNVVQIWAERGIVALCAYLLLLGLFVRECVRALRGPARSWGEAGIAVVVALTVAGLFEFNFGDTEVFYLFLDLIALVIAQLERPAARIGPTDELVNSAALAPA